MSRCEKPVHFRRKDKARSTGLLIVFLLLAWLISGARIYSGLPTLIEDIDLVSQFAWWWLALKVFIMPIFLVFFTYMAYVSTYNCANFIVFQQGLFFPFSKTFIEWKNLETIYGNGTSSRGEVFARNYLKLPIHWKHIYSENALSKSMVNGRCVNKPLMEEISWAKDIYQDQPENLSELRSLVESRFTFAETDFGNVSNTRSRRHQWIYLRRWFFAALAIILIILLYPRSERY